MGWKAIDRITPVVEAEAAPVLSEAVREKIRTFFDRYETRRAVMLPALHIAQDALGHVPPQAMIEIAEVLELHPSDVFDTLTFYTHFWTHPTQHERRRVVDLLCSETPRSRYVDPGSNRTGTG